MDIGKKRVFIDSNVCMRQADVPETTVLPTSYNIVRARLPAMDLNGSMKSHWEPGTFRVTNDKTEEHRLYMDHVLTDQSEASLQKKTDQSKRRYLEAMVEPCCLSKRYSFRIA